MKIFQGAQSICFYKEPHSGGHYISHFIDKQVISVKVALSPKVSYGIRLLLNINRVLVRAFENFPEGIEHLFFYKEAHSGGPYISRFSDQHRVTSIEIAVPSKEG